MPRHAPYQVFVSHATDKWVARTICEKIDAIGGAKTFRDDRDIAGGDVISQELRRQIQVSDEVLVILTPVSVDRPWVLLEIGAAWGQGKAVVPIRYHVEVSRIPAQLQGVKVYELNDFDRYLDELRRRVRTGRTRT